MKKIYFISIILLLAQLNSLAQVTINQSDMVTVGDFTVTTYDTTHTFISPGNAGSTSQNWNFSFQEVGLDSQYYVNPSITPGGNPFPAANLASVNPAGNSFAYYNLSSTLFSQVGYIYIDTASSTTYSGNSTMKILSFPSTYNTALSGSYTINGTPSFNGTDSTKYSYTVTYNSIIDAFGNITTNYFTNVPCLRQKVSQYIVYTDYIKTGGVGAWTTSNTFTDSYFDYHWWTKQQKQSVCNLSYNGSGTLNGVSLLKTYTHGATKLLDINNNVFSIYPNPNNGNFHIRNIGNNKVYIYDVTGKLIYKIDKAENNEEISINNKGLYLVQVIDTKGKISTRKILVE